MKFLGVLLLACLVGCATSSKFGEKLQTWKGQEVSDLVKTWGEPDAIESPHTGNKMYVYARLRREPVAFNSRYENLANATSVRGPSSTATENSDTGVYIHCSTYFEVDTHNLISNVMYRGDECVSKQ
jgi:hypothetical protein